MIRLTPEQHQALSAAGPGAVRAVDPATNAEYVLVPADLYDRLRALGDEDWVADASAAAMEVFARDGWDDPRMDVYDTLDPRERQ